MRRLHIAPAAVQQICAKSAAQRFEGLAFSAAGDILAAATADTNAVVLFGRRNGHGFDDDPYATIENLAYPHDVAFGTCDEREILAVAQRSGVIAIYEEASGRTFGPEPAWVITGAESQLQHTDGVAFVPPYNDHVAACNLLTDVISFYELTSARPVRFANAPVAELKHPSFQHPDGLAFSSDGQWLAVANHASHTVSVFERDGPPAKGRPPAYGPEPCLIIAHRTLRHAHSVAFMPDEHIAVTNAGANYFSVFRLSSRPFRRGIRAVQVQRQLVADDDVFREVNSQNRMEGGPKGIAVHGRLLAVCSPEIGIKIYSARG